MKVSFSVCNSTFYGGEVTILGGQLNWIMYIVENFPYNTFFKLCNC